MTKGSRRSKTISIVKNTSNASKTHLLASSTHKPLLIVQWHSCYHKLQFQCARFCSPETCHWRACAMSWDHVCSTMDTMSCFRHSVIVCSMKTSYQVQSSLVKQTGSIPLRFLSYSKFSLKQRICMQSASVFPDKLLPYDGFSLKGLSLNQVLLYFTVCLCKAVPSTGAGNIRLVVAVSWTKSVLQIRNWGLHSCLCRGPLAGTWVW